MAGIKIAKGNLFHDYLAKKNIKVLFELDTFTWATIEKNH